MFTGQYIETDWARGFCVLIKRRVFDAVGYFDEAFSPGYFDDHDFSIRAIKAAFRCVRAKAAFVLHYRNVTFKQKLKKKGFNQIFERNRKIFYQKWGKPLRIVFILPGLKGQIHQRLDKLFVNLSRDQNRVYILSEEPTGFSCHDNIYKIRILRWLFALGVLFFIWDNSHRNSAKHYNLIFLASLKLKKMLSLLGFSNKYKISPFDFLSPQEDESILETVKDMKFNQDAVLGGR